MKKDRTTSFMSQNIFSRLIAKSRSIIEEHKRTIKWVMVALIITSIALCGGCSESNAVRRGEIESFRVIDAIARAFNPNIGWTLAIFVFLCICAFMISQALYTGTEYNEESKTEVVKSSNECGSAERMGREEKKEAFTRNTICDTTDNFLGEDPYQGGMSQYVSNATQVYSIKKGFGTNDNAAFFGAPGCGKSACLLINFVFQIMRRGESGVVSDTKGALYNQLAVAARTMGYVVKIINLDPRRLLHSDSCDPFEVIINDLNQAATFSETIIANLKQGREQNKDFWEYEEENLLTFAILYTVTNTLGFPKTMPQMYYLLNHWTVEDVEEVGTVLPEEHPAKIYYNNYISADKVVKGNALGGLQTQLAKMGIPAIKKIFGVKDMDFALPAKKKCLYFINIAANDRSMSYFSAFVFDMLMREQERVALEQVDGRCPIPVNYEMDEIYNLGIVPNLDNRIATLRAAGISIHMFFQSIGQIQTMYPDGLWEGVLECCHVIGVVKANTNTTCQYFQEMGGVQTVRSESLRYVENVANKLHVHMTKQITVTNTQRYVYFADEIRRMSSNNMLIFVGGHNPIELRKILYTSHPMMKICRTVNSSRHLPKWVQELNESEYELYGINDKVIFEDESIWDGLVSPMREEDYLETWSKRKQKELDKKIKKQLAEIEGIDVPEDDPESGYNYNDEKQKRMSSYFMEELEGVENDVPPVNPAAQEETEARKREEQDQISVEREDVRGGHMTEKAKKQSASEKKDPAASKQRKYKKTIVDGRNPEPETPDKKKQVQKLKKNTAKKASSETNFASELDTLFGSADQTETRTDESDQNDEHSSLPFG